MLVTVHQSPSLLGEAIADSIISGLKAAQRSGRPYLLGCPSGRTPRPIYQALAERVAASDTDLSGVILVMMDEYLEESESSLNYVDKNRHYSCRRFAEQEIAELLNDGLAASYGIAAEHVWFPDPQNAAAYDDRIASEGGIDLFILASGASDGHVAFNPSGSERDSNTRVIRLAEQTRQDNLHTFPQFKSLDEVPQYGISVGVGTIVNQSKAAMMVLVGDGKRQAYKKITAARSYDPAWPSSIIVECPNAALHADAAAAAG